jgi:hypothetical protein
MGQQQAILRTYEEGGRKYQYQPLIGKSIRLIHLHKTKKHEIYCTLEHVTLEKHSKYTALSYAWGSSDTPFCIEVRNGHKDVLGSIPLTTNLQAAILDLWCAPGVRPKVFWIDQIAIDQTNIAERNSQVAHMAEIYQTATQVVTYLGPRTVGDVAALKLMKRVEAHYQRQYILKLRGSDLDREVLEEQAEVQRDASYATSYRHLILNGHPGQDMLRELIEPAIGPDDPGWQVALEISTPACSQRLWMVQENMLNKTTHMLRGPFLVEWEMVASFAGMVNILPAFAHNQALASPTQGPMLQMWGMKRLKTAMTLMELMWMLQNYGCSNPRDRVYACLGIARDADALGIQPDYSVSVEDLYTEVARQTLRHHQHLECLDYVLEPDHSMPQPSWAPQRWGEHSEISTRRFKFSSSDVFGASGDYAGEVQFDGDTLIVQGAIEDVITSHQFSIHFRDRDYYTTLFHSTDMHCKMLLETSKHDVEDLRSRYIQLIEFQLARVEGYQAHIKEMEAWATVHSMDDDLAATAVYCTLASIRRYPDDFPAQKGLETIKRSIATDRTGLRDLSRIVAGHSDLFDVKRPQFKISPPKFTDDERVLEGTLFGHSIARVKRTIFCTESGRFGSVYGSVDEGDKIAILKGGRAIYVLRPSGEEYRFVASAYVYGLMDGEACLDPSFESRIQTIRIR